MKVVKVNSMVVELKEYVELLETMLFTVLSSTGDTSIQALMKDYKLSKEKANELNDLYFSIVYKKDHGEDDE